MKEPDVSGHITGHPRCVEAGEHVCARPSGRSCVDCGAPAGTLWSPYWCMDCDSRRMERVDGSLRALQAQLNQRPVSEFSPRRVLITGSRDWQDEALIQHVLDGLREELGSFVLVHGDARGADRMGQAHQLSKGEPVEAHPANWGEYGKSAGYIRNAEMVNLGADVCVAFIRNESRGATMCAELAEKSGIETRRYLA